MRWFSCNDCNKVAPLFTEGKEDKCPLCNSQNGEVMSQERLDETMKAGAIWNINPKGKKPRR